MSHLRLVTDELQEIAAANRAVDEEVVGEAVINNDPELVTLDEFDNPVDDFGNSFPNKKTKADDPDVLGLAAATIWTIADLSNVSRGKVRRVLAAFEPAFWQRLDEAYRIGHGDGQLAIMMQLEGAKDEHSDDPEGSEGREEGLPSEA